MLWISYEQLVTKPLESIQAIADFLGVDTINDSTLVQRVADGSNFNKVKRAAQVALGKGCEGNITHLRKGKVGDWRNHFTDELYRQFEHEICSHFHEDSDGSCIDLEYDIGEERVWKPASGANGGSSVRSVK